MSKDILDYRGETWQFIVEWYDPHPQMKKKYVLKYSVEPHQVEMVDMKSKRMFLKRCDCPPEITTNDFYVGNKIILLSRELDIIDYADSITRQKLQHQMQRSLILFTPDSYHNWGKMLEIITNRLSLVKLRTVNFSEHQAENACQVLSLNTRRAPALARGICLVAYVQGEDGIGMLGEEAESLVAEYSAGETSPALMCPYSGTQVNDFTEMLSTCQPTSTLDSCTCCVIKPHAVKERNVAKILDIIITQGYEVSAVETLYFDKAAAEEFLEVYKGVVPEYVDQVNHLSSGMSIALEIRAEDAVTVFRQTAGPWDVDMAKELQPTTIRALYGKDRVRNAVHCTDLPTDGNYECEYCFNIMSSSYN